MSTGSKRKVATVCGDGHLRVIEQAAPELRHGTVLVDVHASLVSPGTELNGWRSLAEKRRNPDAGAAPRPFGYSNAGIVRAVGEGVTEFKPGSRVVCIGAGYALHTDLAVVPHNLCAALPCKVTFAQGAYAMLAATALHTLRRGEPQFGESVGVLGLGLVGQLTAQLYKLAGNYVIGWDQIERRLRIAKEWGIDGTVAAGAQDEVAAARMFTRGLGLDAAVMANAGECDETVQKLVRSMKVSSDGHPMGRIMIVGWPTFQFASLIGGMNNLDIRRCSRTGPGYHVDAWEVGGAYPPVFMRWTTRTNLDLCMRLIEEGRLNVDVLTTHRIPFQDMDAQVDRLLDDPDAMLGVVFEYER
jgi:threonine dehydrogenase-like Zn-dependent dehydrogenase